ncbi:MAG: tRNA-intron lyase [Candidatus Methanoperedenaceae archaeon]|nr:MAG: tRNA-intron lyase [Candidatus Methanoperedenaceae archaeon]
MTLKGKLIIDSVLLEKQAIEELHNKSYYGRVKGGTLEISLPESAFLIYMEKIRVEFEEREIGFEDFFLMASSILKNFELLYIVYKDLRERGYYVQPGVTGFRVYPRGGHPGKTPAEFFVFVTSERIPLLISQLRLHLETVENLKKRLVVAIVDEDSDITYYEVKKASPSGTNVSGLNKGLSKASLLEDRVMVWNQDASLALQKDGFFGKPMDEGHLQLSLIESCYLLRKGILEIENRNHELLDFEMFVKTASSIESDFMIKYAVYETLRNNGLVPKTGFKFGTHFRVYKKIDDMIKLPHSDYLVHAVEQSHVFSLQQLSRAVRLANSVRKEMIYGTVDSRVDFFIIGRMRL